MMAQLSMQQSAPLSLMTKTDMGAVYSLPLPIMDDILSPIYEAESDLAAEMSLESDPQDIPFSNNEDNTLYPIDFTLLEETQAFHDARSQLIEDMQPCSSTQLELDLYENLPVSLDDIFQQFPQPFNTPTPPPSLQQALNSSMGSKVKELSLKLKPTAITASSCVPTTPDLIRTILHLETAEDQTTQKAKSCQPTASAFTTINVEALCGGDQILLHQSPASSSPPSPPPPSPSSPSPSSPSPSSPSPSSPKPSSPKPSSPKPSSPKPSSPTPSSPSPTPSSSSLASVSREPSLSRPGTSCSSIAPASPAPSIVQRSIAPKRPNADPLPDFVDSKKLKNNEASRKSRLKRKERQHNQVEQIKQLERDNRQLVQKVAELERLRDLLRSYSNQVTFVVSAVR